MTAVDPYVVPLCDLMTSFLVRRTCSVFKDIVRNEEALHLDDADAKRPEASLPRDIIATIENYQEIRSAYAKCCKDWFACRAAFVENILKWSELTQTDSTQYLGRLMINTRWFGGLIGANDMKDVAMRKTASAMLDILERLHEGVVPRNPIFDFPPQLNIAAWEESTDDSAREYSARRTLVRDANRCKIADAIGIPEDRRVVQTAPCRVSYTAKGVTFNNDFIWSPGRFIPWSMLSDPAKLLYWVRVRCEDHDNKKDIDFMENEPSHNDIRDLIDLVHAHWNILAVTNGKAHEPTPPIAGEVTE